MIVRPGELPGIPMTAQATDKVAIDITGFDGETMGGIHVRGFFRTPVNGQGQTVRYCVCPNDLETNQDCRGDIVATCLPLASYSAGLQETIFYEWWMRDTKAGRGRLFESVCWKSTPTKQIVTGVWLDSATPITSFRMRAIKADGTNTGSSVNWFLKDIPGVTGLTLSQHGWTALGLP